MKTADDVLVPSGGPLRPALRRAGPHALTGARARHVLFGNALRGAAPRRPEPVKPGSEPGARRRPGQLESREAWNA